MSRRLRKIWMAIHLWLGLTLGLLFALTGLSGSLLVFDHAIDEWLHPDLLLAEGSGVPRPLDEVIASAEEAFPSELARASFIETPRFTGGVWIIWCRSDHGSEFTQVYVDPSTAEVTGRREMGRFFVSWVYEFHDQMLAGETGATIVGLTGLGMVASIGTGIFLWWPLWRNSWRAAFAIRGGRRFNYDLHKSMGIVSAIILLVISFSGVYMVFPGWVKPCVHLVLPQSAPVAGDLQSTPIAGKTPITPGQAAESARQVFADGELKRLHFPDGPTGTYIARIRRAGEVRRSSGNSRVWIEQYSGEIIAVRDWNRSGAADTFFAWQFPLHNGEAFGLVGRWIVFFTGLAPGVLYITGFVLWWRKRQSRKRQLRHADGVEGGRV